MARKQNLRFILVLVRLRPRQNLIERHPEAGSTSSVRAIQVFLADYIDM